MEWRWADPRGQQRLVRTDELRAALADGVLAPNTPVWQRGWHDWKPANEVPELMQAAFAAENGQSLNVPPPPLFIVAVQAEYEGAPGTKDLGPEEPPPPPKYVPLASASPKPTASPKPAPAAASPKPAPIAKIELAKVPALAPAGTSPAPSKLTQKPEPKEPPKKKPSMAPPPKKAASVAPPPLPKKAASVAPPPLPKKGASVAPPPLPKKGASVAPPPLPAAAHPVIPKAPLAPADRTLETLASMGDEATTVEAEKFNPKVARTVVGVPSLPTSSLKISTPTVSPAPPPMPLSTVSALEAAKEREREKELEREREREAPPVTAPAPKRYPTLIDFDGGGSPPPPTTSKDDRGIETTQPMSPPIIVPSPSKGPVGSPGAVTQAPPWGEGAAEVKVPKSALPRMPPPEETLVVPVTIPAEARVSVVEQSPAKPEGGAVEVVRARPLGAGSKANTLLGIAPASLTRTAPLPGDTEPVLPSEPETLPALGLSSEPLPAPEPVFVPPPQRAPRGSIPDEVRRILALPRWQIITGSVAVVVLLLGLGGLLSRLIGGGGPGPVPTTSATTGSTTIPTVAVTSTPTVASTARVPVVAPIVCKVTGDAKLIAPKALIGSGIEAVGLHEGVVGVGFAVAPKEGSVVTLDPANANSTGTKKVKATETIRRVTPIDGDGTVDFDRKGDVLKSRRAVAGAFDVGVLDQQLVITSRGKDDTQKLWSLETDAPVEALRGVALGEGIAVAYRHAGAIWVGAVKADRTAISQPTRVAGLGPQVGSPALAASSGTVVIAWADRAAASDPWGLRVLSWHPGEAAKSAQPFKLPAGGLGEHAMSPGLAALSGGRFLLVWTEGPVSSHQVRAQVLGPDGTPAGEAFAVSGDGVNAGQGQAAVLADGHGVVAFLASSGKTFDVRATPILCQ